MCKENGEISKINKIIKFKNGSLVTLFLTFNSFSLPPFMQSLAWWRLFCIININKTLKKEELDAYVDISMEI